MVWRNDPDHCDVLSGSGTAADSILRPTVGPLADRIQALGLGPILPEPSQPLLVCLELDQVQDSFSVPLAKGRHDFGRSQRPDQDRGIRAVEGPEDGGWRKWLRAMAARLPALPWIAWQPRHDFPQDDFQRILGVVAHARG